MQRGRNVFDLPGPFEDMRPLLVNLSKRVHADLAKIMSRTPSRLVFARTVEAG